MSASMADLSIPLTVCAAGKAALLTLPHSSIFGGYPSVPAIAVESMKARIPRMLLTVCAEGQALEMLTCPAVTGTPGGLPILVLVGDIVLG